MIGESLFYMVCIRDKYLMSIIMLELVFVHNYLTEAQVVLLCNSNEYESMLELLC